MKLSQDESLCLSDARALVRRSVDKAEELSSSGVFIAVDESGAPVSSSRMDDAEPFAVPVTRAKAYCAAASRVNSEVVFERLAHRYLGHYFSYREFARDTMFAAQGGMLIRKNDVVVGALATGAAIGPFVTVDGVAPEQLIIDGRPANLEDLIICYALGVPYESQHGSDEDRWMEAYGKPASDFGPGTGFQDPPAASRQERLDNGIALADAAIGEASAQNAAISVVVIDRSGDQIQLDRMDGASPMSPDLADAVAVTAANFRMTSREAAGRCEATPGLSRIGEIIPYPFAAVPGGVPIFDGDRPIGAIGVAGADLDPLQCERIAEQAVKSCGGSTQR